MKFVVREDQNVTSLLPFWTVLSSQALFSWRHSMQDILTKWLPTSLLTITLGYGCSEAILFWDKHALNSKKGSSEDKEVDHCWEKSTVTFYWPCESVAGFLLSANFESQPGCQIQFKMAASKVTSLEKNFFRIAALKQLKPWWAKKVNVCYRQRQK